MYSQKERIILQREITEMRKQGYTFREIGSQMNKSLSSIQRLVKLYMPKKRKATKHINISPKEMDRLYNDKLLSSRTRGEWFKVEGDLAEYLSHDIEAVMANQVAV